MNDVFKSLKELLSFYWTPSKTPQDKIIKRYDFLISLCVTFIIIYVSHLLFTYQNVDVIPKPSPVNSGIPSITFHSNVVKNRVSTITTNISVKSDEFYIGEIVTIKDFGVYGKVVQKILGTTGYTYKVRWKNNERDLPSDVFYPWELEKTELPISVLQN